MRRGQASRVRVQGRGTPDPPAVDGVRRETARQAVESLGWTVRRRPARYVSLLALLLMLSFADAAIVLWGRPWWLQLACAVLVLLVAIAIGFTVRSARSNRHTYASPDARLAIEARDRGWYFADHVARPGTRGEGRELRRRVSNVLTSAADQQHVVVYAHTISEKLARAYMADIPGLRIASVRGDRILLVRPPRRHLR